MSEQPILTAEEKAALLQRISSLEENIQTDHAELVSLKRVVLGDASLNVPPIRDELTLLITAYRRAKWVIGTLGLTNATTLFAVARALLGQTP